MNYERKMRQFARSREAFYGKNRAEAASGREAFLQGKIVKGVYGDEHLIHREVYNPNSFEVIFRRSRDMDAWISNSKIPLGPRIAICKPDDWLYLPHGYYVASGVGLPDGTPVSILVNYGDSIGVGNKKASLPSL